MSADHYTKAMSTIASHLLTPGPRSFFGLPREITEAELIERMATEGIGDELFVSFRDCAEKSIVPETAMTDELRSHVSLTIGCLDDSGRCTLVEAVRVWETLLCASREHREELLGIAIPELAG